MRGRVALLIACAAGCGERSSPPAASPFLDPEGRVVTVAPLPVDRVVSTMQSATEWLVALGAAEVLVARTDYDRQPELAKLPSIGGGYDPSPEAIAALHPDVVLGWRMRASVDLAHALTSFSIPVIAIEATDTAEAFAQLAVLATLVGREARGAALADSLRRVIAAGRARSCPTGAPTATALLVISTEPPMAAGGGTWMSELLGGACLENVFADLDTPWGTVSMEAITARNPTWIITGGGRDGAAPALGTLAGWRDLPAVRAGRILTIDADLYSRLGPRMAEWVAAIILARDSAEAVGP